MFEVGMGDGPVATEQEVLAAAQPPEEVVFPELPPPQAEKPNKAKTKINLILFNLFDVMDIHSGWNLISEPGLSVNSSRVTAHFDMDISSRH